MCPLSRACTFVAATGIVAALSLGRVFAGGTDDSSRGGDRPSSTTPAQAGGAPKSVEDEPPAVSLLDAMRQGRVAVQAEGRDDGRIAVSVTNRTRKPLRVVLPPGIIAQAATGQMGGMMGGMGGGMGGGGMGGMGGMGGGMGGMGGGMGGGMRGGMGRGGGTMPPMMGLMTLGRLIMYFCGDYDSWDMRSLMISMGRMGGMGMGGGMGGMGGGMGGMMGGMGGGMRSVPPTGLPFADLKPGQTRHLPTRMVSLNPPDAQGGVQLPREGQAFRVADIGDVSADPRVQKAMKRLAAEKAASNVAQLVMWKVAAGLDWGAIAELSRRWANGYELALARDFVDHLDAATEWETGRIYFEVAGTGGAAESKAAGLRKAIEGKVVLGLRAAMGVPARPGGPALACRVVLKGGEAQVQLSGSDAKAEGWVPLGKFAVPLRGETNAEKLADAVAEGLLGRLVRAELVKGPRAKGKLTHRIHIRNGSPLRLNGLAAVGLESKADEEPRVLSGISIPPRRGMTVPASEEVVKALGLKHGIRLTAVDLSGL